MPEYTFADIITGKDILTNLVKDKDIIGAKGYFASDFKTIVDSFDDKTFPDSLLEGTLETVSYVGRFRRKEDGIYFDYFIRKKEPKYVPFDLNDPEVRKSLRGRWITADGDEGQITGFHLLNGEEWAAYITIGYVTGTMLHERWKFEDGTPCGKLVEEE